ncbi:MAG: YfcE family phosphodiesterase [Candidatus Nanoarchaeia archaeon]|nr:YfcE family phosphodiesterase [Candidatus Nanoarchaeia archaeon]
MKIGLISDTHNNMDAVKRSYDIFEENKVDCVIHCGDLVDFDILKDIKIKTYFVYGNLDKPIKLSDDIFMNKNIDILGYVGILNLDGKNIFICHGNNEEILNNAIESLKYDYIFTGHTHKNRDEIIYNSRIINPGAHNIINTNEKDRTIAVLDIAEDNLKFFFLTNG